MINYNFFLLTIAINVLLFIIYIKTAKKLGFIDKSKKFDNPVTVTSSGIIIYLNLLILFIFSFFLEENYLNNLPNNYIFTFFCLSILVFISTFDDIKPIDPKIRLFFQLICVYFSLSSVPIYLMEIPLKVSIIICLFIWVYILNITNFTDGSDGFLAINTVFLFLNFIYLDYSLELNTLSRDILIFLLPSIIVFIFFNKPHAKLYFGDGGSILIGFINGFLFLNLMILDKINFAISILIYPIIDCSYALIRKTLQGKLPWADISNYSFLQPSIKKNHNKLFVFYINILFNIFNSLLIIFQLFYGSIFIFLNILLTITVMIIYEKKS